MNLKIKYNQFTVDMGRRIYERRKSLGMTQEELAEKMDVSPQTISYTEQGTKAMRPENLVKLCRILDVSTDYILTGETPSPKSDSLVEKLSYLSKEEMVFVEMIINSCIGLCNLKHSQYNSSASNEPTSTNG